MKMDLEARCFLRRGNSLVPADSHAEELFEGIKEGKQVLVRVTKARNVDQHRKLFAMLRVVIDNSDKYESVDVLLALIKLAVGLYDVVQSYDGSFVKIPKSISFASMNQDAFERFFPRATYIMSKLSGIPESVLLEESNV